MIAVIVTLTAKEGRGDSLTSILSLAGRRVLAEEPGCVLYKVMRAKSEQNVFKVFQVYASQVALDAHRQTPHAKALGAELNANLSEPGSVEFLDIVE